MKLLSKLRWEKKKSFGLCPKLLILVVNFIFESIENFLRKGRKESFLFRF